MFTLLLLSLLALMVAQIPDVNMSSEPMSAQPPVMIPKAMVGNTVHFILIRSCLGQHLIRPKQNTFVPAVGFIGISVDSNQMPVA